MVSSTSPPSTSRVATSTASTSRVATSTISTSRMTTNDVSTKTIPHSTPRDTTRNHSTASTCARPTPGGTRMVSSTSAQPTLTGTRIVSSTGSCNTSEAPLGVEDGRIKKYQMISSTEQTGFSASKGRLNGADSWRPASNDQNQWLQVDLGKKELVTAIATQGFGNSWVKTYSISYGVDKENLTSYKINATQKVFAGNYDKSSVVTNLLYPAINARYIRIHPVSWFSHISLRIEVIGCYTGFCNISEVPLGIEDGRIKNFQMSSSTDKNGFSPSKGRLNGADSWRPTNNDQNQWLQVNLGKKEFVTAIATQGSGNASWVETYSLSYGVHKENLTSYKINATQKVFAGNYDKNSVVTNLLYPAINARYIRIHPVSWFNQISLRIEVIGCYTGSCNTSEVPLGVEDGRIKNSQVSSSTEKNGSSTSKGRLNGANSWRPANNDQNQWLQVDLDKKELVTAIATQGSGDGCWVKTYSISYGVDKENLTSYKINATQKVFDGNTDENSVVTNVLSPAVTAHYIRIHPKTWNIHISLRVELYGCQRVKAIPCKTGEKTLGVEDKNKVKDSQLTSSSYWNTLTSAASGRLYNVGEWGKKWIAGWIAGVNDRNQWIQVDLGKKEVVSGIATQGGYYYIQYYNLQNFFHFCWVKTYSVTHSLNGTTFESYKDKIFDGNSDWNTIVKNVLSPPITARYIRIHPESWDTYLCMGIELYGCF
ncbi:uncharacterized protein LOC114519442 isoform X2 [Dendronephthya gigantea]|nr:uncharacterized protein LOC114519442 isoform X2 [Dendronephthya gigantea]